MQQDYIHHRCELYGYRSQLQCQKPAVAGLVSGKTGVCKKHLEQLIKEQYFSRQGEDHSENQKLASNK